MSQFTYAELFAGAGGLSMGLELAGWEPVAHAEIEPHARAVLRHHWPECRLDGDVSAINGADYAGVTLLSGGSPCQDLSIAGKRNGMTEGSGTRSSLYFEQVRIWNESGAPYFLWENVLGAFSSNNGRDFAAVLSALVGAAVPVPANGWESAGVAAGPTGVAAWRVLDCQFFGPPQRRRRVFVLGTRTGGVDPAEVLAVSEGVCGDSATGEQAREGAAADAGGGADATGRQGGVTAVVWDAECNPAVSVMGTLNIGSKTGGGHPAGVVSFAQNQLGEVRASSSVVGALGTNGNASGRAVPLALTYEWHNQDSRVKQVDVASTLNLNADGREGHLVLHGPVWWNGSTIADALTTTSDAQRMPDKGRLQVAIHTGIPRRLMPVECERLMGWPDGHTETGVDEQGRTYALSDTARYRLCGNGVASPVAGWIAWRLRWALEAQGIPVAEAA